ncbi:MAG: hypothetical protein IPG71_04675 [bacterium]|nr:hypothetical protein [bacterium]
MLSCEIHGNEAGNRGGGMYSATQRWVQQTTVRNCLWYDNVSNVGSAIAAENAEILVDFTTVALNTSLAEGTAIQADGCSLVVHNTIFAHLPSGAIGHVNAQLTLGTNCFFDVGDAPIVGTFPEGIWRVCPA